MPAVIASLSCIGTASKTSLRSPVAARITMMRPLMTTSPIASGQVSEPTRVVATNELMPRPAANANGSRAMRPNRIVMTPAVSDVVGRDLVELQLGSGDIVAARQDDRVQHDDVGHRDERDQAAANLGGDRRPPRRDLEEAIEAIHSLDPRVAADARHFLQRAQEQPTVVGRQHGQPTLLAALDALLHRGPSPRDPIR